MKSPYTYSEWVNCFDIIKQANQDTEIMECIQKGRIEISSGMTGRFAEHVNTTIQVRLKRAMDSFSRSVQATNSDHNVMVNSLLALRREFKFLMKLSKIQGLPESTAAILVDAIQDQADKLQDTLEKNSKSDRSGVLYSLVKKNRVNYLED